MSDLPRDDIIVKDDDVVTITLINGSTIDVDEEAIEE